MTDKIKLYPSNWLFNAGVIGFLRVIAYSENENMIVEWLKDDGTVEVDSSIFEIKNSKPKALNAYYEYHNHKPPIIGNTLYKNFINPSSKQRDESALSKLVESFKNNLQVSPDFENCGICGTNLGILNIESELTDFLNKRQMFNIVHGNYIAPSTGEFPNAFWNLNASLSICPLCIYLIIHHHIPFVDTYIDLDSKGKRITKQKIFINGPSFKIMWYLNKFSEKLLKSKEQYNLRKILGLSLMELSQKIYVSLGAWSMMNIEMIIKKYDLIDYYSLPYEVSLVLLQKDISSLISQTKEHWILELVLDGNYDMLLNLSRKILRYIITKENINKDRSLSNLKNRDFYSLKNLIHILPELYIKINLILNKEVIV